MRIEKFVGYKRFNIHKFRESGWSFGIHFSQTLKRVDIHLFCWIISFGKIPIHRFSKGDFAVSDSYHQKVVIEHQIVEYCEPSGKPFV
jgi:hypothetical protein